MTDEAIERLGEFVVLSVFLGKDGWEVSPPRLVVTTCDPVE